MNLFAPQGTLKPLRGRQIPVIDAIADAIRAGHRRIIVQAPTGFGKTILAAHLMDRSARKGKRPMFVAPAISLIEQTLASFEAQGIGDIGVIQQQHHRTDFRAQIQLASRDTLIRRELPQVDFVIVDEVHDRRDALDAIIHSPAWADKVVVGLDATPWTKGLGLYWSKLIVAATLREMIEDGPPTGLCAYKGWGPSADASDVGVRRTASGEFNEADAGMAMNQPRLVGDAVESWLRRRHLGEHCGDRTFLYGVNRAHAKSLMERFIAEGVRCGYMDGETGGDDRLKTFKAYRKREIEILCNVGVLITGVDEDVRSIIDCAMRASEINWVQAFGRGLRLADGKDYLRHYDHGGNFERLGRPEDIMHDHLDIREPSSKESAYEDEKPTPKPRKCQKCHFMIPPKTKACPKCGDVYVKPNTIEHEAGELVEITSGGKKKSKKEPTPQEKEAFYAGLIHYADDKGWKRGAADHIFKEKYGHFPSRKQGVQPSTPTADVLGFIRHRNIARAKAKQKEAVSA